MKTTFFLLLIFIQAPLFAQFNCKTTKRTDGSEEKKCYHKNGKVSTIETWEKDKHHGNLEGFNNQGKELFSLALRHDGGHASASLSWYSNGQVKNVSYSDAPDGGIQYYHSTTQFDESGKQTSFTEDSYDDKLQLDIREIPVQDTIKTRKPLVEINRVLEEPVAKKRLEAVIENKSNKKVSLTIKFPGRKKEESMDVDLKPGESFLLDTHKFVPPDFDATPFFSIKLLTRKCALQRQPDQSITGEDEVFQVTWFVTKK